MDTCHFAGEIIRGLEDICYPEGRNPDERKRTLYLNNALIHDISTGMGQLEQSEFKRVEQPPYSPDLARVTSFFLDT
jgi:transposase